MEKTASQIQKERAAALEQQADALLKRCPVATLTSLNEKGCPRTCALSVAKEEGFRDIYFVTSRRSAVNGKAAHFEADPRASVCYFLGGDSVTLMGEVEFVHDKALQAEIWAESDRRFFKNGIDDPKYRLLHFHTREATFWIGGRFRTCKYKT